MSKKKNKVNNLVAKHMEEFNRPVTHEDRKKSAKNGKIKHKSRNFGFC